MKPSRQIETSTLRLISLITLILFISIGFAANKYITALEMKTATDINTPNKVNTTIYLETTEITTGSDTSSLSEATETGKVSAEVIRRSYTTHPINEQEVLVYFISGDAEELICTLTTDEKGEAGCVRVLETTKCGLVVARYAGTEEYTKSTSLPYNHCSVGIPPFSEIVGPEWLVLFMFIGLLAAGLYASGKKPGSAFDVTTPKLKGAVAGKAKEKIRTSLGGMYGAVVPAVSAAIVIRMNNRRLSQNIEEAKKVIIKHGTPEMVKKLKRAKNISKDNMVRLVRNMMIGGGYGSLKQGGLYRSLKQKLTEKQEKRREVLRLSKEATGAKASEIKMELTELDRKISTYKKDLIAISPTSLLPGENFVDINPKSYLESGSAIKASILGIVLGERGRWGGSELSQKIDEQATGYADTMEIGDKGESLREYPTLRSGLVDIISVKADLDRVRLVIYGKMLVKLKEKKIDNSKEYKDIFRKKSPMQETGKDLLALVKKLGDKEYETMLKILKEVDTANLKIALIEKKFLDSLGKIREINEKIEKGLQENMVGANLEELKRRLEEATEDAGMAYLILKKRAKGYRDVIERDMGREKMPLKIRKEDVPEFGEILINDAFGESKENKTDVVNVLIDTYLEQRFLPGGAPIAERHLIEIGNEVIYVNEKERKIKTLHMIKDLRSKLLGGELKTDVRVPENLSVGKLKLIEKLEKIRREIMMRREIIKINKKEK